MRTMELEKPEWIPLAKFANQDGVLNVCELPFEVTRTYYIQEVPYSSQRGFHAHRSLRQIFFAPKGNFELELSTPFTKDIYLISSIVERALIVPPGYWRVLSRFSEEAICMVLASDFFDPKDYIRNFSEYTEWFRENIKNES